MKYIIHIDRKRRHVENNLIAAVIWITRTLDSEFGADKWAYEQLHDRDGQFIWKNHSVGFNQYVAAFIETVSDEIYEQFVKDKIE